MPDPNHRRKRYVVILLHAIFLFSGIATILVGQVLPILARKFELNDLQLSYFFPVQFAGSLLGTSSSRYFAQRNGFISATVIGCFSMAAGLLLLNAGTFSFSLAGFFLNGIGIGLTLPSINLLVFEMNPMRSGSALSILNFCWGVGAILCKPFVDFTVWGTDLALTTSMLAVPMAVAAALIFKLGRSATRPAEAAETRIVDDVRPIWSTSLAWVLTLFNFIQVGFESGIGGWLTTYSERMGTEQGPHLISPTFLYFSFFVLGRGVAPVLYRYFEENTVIMIDLVIVLIGTIITLSADSILILSIGASISGFGASSVFPATVSRFGRIFGPSATRRATPLFIGGTVGAALVTSLIGVVSDRTGSLRSGMFVILLCVIVLIVLQVYLGARTKRKDPADNAS